MDIIFQQSCKLKPATLQKIRSFTSILKGFCSDLELYVNIFRYFRNVYFLKHLSLAVYNRSNQFSKYSSSPILHIQCQKLGAEKT